MWNASFHTMKMPFAPITVALLFPLFNASICMPTALGGDPDLEHIKLPEGFRISVFAEDVENARAMCWGEKGTLFVGSRKAGIVHALRDTDGDGRADEKHIIARGLNMPAGVAFRDGDLYVSSLDRIVRLKDIEDHLEDPPSPETVIDGYPDETAHGWKFIAFGPEGKLYIPVGAPCNICLSENEIFASITRVNIDGTDREIVAHGVRNTVGFDWHPETGELWAMDHGRDWHGHDSPAEELNRVVFENDYGWPFCYGDRQPDPTLAMEPTGATPEEYCALTEPPVLTYQAHSSPISFSFYTGGMFPEEYVNDAFLTLRGSWNRQPAVGYKVVRVLFGDDGQPTGFEDFVTGFLLDNGEEQFGRPAGLLILDDGSLLFTDDTNGIIYRVTYDGE